MSQVVEKICQICGKRFSVKRYRVETAKYCSNTCRYESLRAPRMALEKRFWDKVDKSSDCWVWQGCTQSQGYGQIRINGKAILTHRLAWEFENGQIPDGLFACHKCDNPPCVRLDHLFLGTAADNTADMYSKGREYHPAGEDAGKALFTNEEAWLIRDDPRPVAEIATERNVSRMVISNIRKGLTYEQVDKF